MEWEWRVKIIRGINKIISVSKIGKIILIKKILTPSRRLIQGGPNPVEIFFYSL